METVDVQKEALEEIELLGKAGYFTELRVDKGTVPDGMHCYELRHGDDWGFPVSVEESVRVNYFGAVILAEELELGEEKALQLGYEDFGYTGRQMCLPQAQGKQPEEKRGAEGYETMLSGAELIRFVEENGISFPMDEKEAGLICGYMEGHGYVIGQNGGQLCRGDLHTEAGRVLWEETTIDDLVDAAAEWNYEILQEARQGMEKPGSFADLLDQNSRYKELCAEERMLDAMFDRTKYGKQIEAMAETMAAHFIQSLQGKGSIDRAVEELAHGIKGAGGRQGKTAAKPEEKQKGRAR